MIIRDLRLLATIVAAMVVIDALWSPVILAYAALAPLSFTEQIRPIAESVDTASLVFKLATFVVFASWIYAAGRNLVAADADDLKFTPASRIWWFAVPFANLVMPYHGMRELWNASRNVWPVETNTPIVAIWWSVWLGSGVLAWLLTLMTGTQGGGINGMYALCVIAIVRAVIAIILVRGITEGQRQLGGTELSEVFA
ncbi:DUF4328 domain-containing protein [Sphingomonas sp. AR_OL41]|uniref:DUF4328 domain-containing protein n=1 Tax=Sphingomonas sp. AR_OL41 TaxID=3042729 RepID=UPI002480EA59|nr:DUF4328 domain-containing protein [Sphingomonas sp. AR_OL41]MDH7972301.1 DUF4328 domain-containing protein [Sphingomonas sp. AR_OL41]